MRKNVRVAGKARTDAHVLANLLLLSLTLVNCVYDFSYGRFDLSSLLGGEFEVSMHAIL